MGDTQATVSLYGLSTVVGLIINVGETGIGQVFIDNSMMRTGCDGIDREYEAGGELIVGSKKTGVVEVMNEGLVEGSEIIVARDAGSNGTLRLKTGSTVTDLRNSPSKGTIIAKTAGSEGTVEVGQDSEYDGMSVVGMSGKGVLTITDNGYVLAGQGWPMSIGDQSTGEGQVSISRGNMQSERPNLKVSNELWVGRHGKGKLTIDNKGEVEVTTHTTIGRKSSAHTSEVFLDHQGHLQTKFLYIGGEAQGVLNAKNGGKVDVTDAMEVGSPHSGDMNLESGAKVTAKSGLVKNLSKVTLKNAGTVWKITDAASEFPVSAISTIDIYEDAIIDHEGKGYVTNSTIRGDSTIKWKQRAEMKDNGAILVPQKLDGSVATLRFDTDQFDSFAGMTLQIDAPTVNQGTGEANSDRLHVTGNTTVGGIVTANVGFNPVPWRVGASPGSWIHVLSSDGALNGKISASALPSLDTFVLPEPAAGHHFEWRVVHNEDEAESDPVLEFLGYQESQQPWLSNGTRDVVLVVVEIPDPVAVADSGLTPEDNGLSVPPEGGVLSNDSYYGNDPMQAQLVNDADHGDLTLNSDGSYSFSPDPGFVGTDFFTYRVVAGQWESAEQTVTITVAEESPTLVAVNDAYHDNAMRQIMAVNPGILSNDTGGGTLGYSTYLVSNVTHGTLTLQANGGFDYVPAENFYDSDSFSYRVFDGTYFSNVATVTLTMDDPNVMAMDDSYMTMAGIPLNVSAPGVRGNDMYVTTAQYIAGSGPAEGTLSFSSDGSFSYTPPAGYTGSVTFQYTGIHAPSGAQDGPATVTIQVMNILTLDQPPATTGGAAALEAAQLDAIFRAAARRWQRAGVSDEALADGLAGVQLGIADLPGSILGAALGRQILVDVDGAGFGWFVDATPADDREFAQWTFASQRVALAGSPAQGYVDLLTVVEHEIGHVLGLSHSNLPGNIMQDTLSLSTRRWATSVDAAIAQWLYESGERDRRR